MEVTHPPLKIAHVDRFHYVMRRKYYIARKILTKVENATVTLEIYFIVLFMYFVPKFFLDFSLDLH